MGKNNKVYYCLNLKFFICHTLLNFKNLNNSPILASERLSLFNTSSGFRINNCDLMINKLNEYTNFEVSGFKMYCGVENTWGGGGLKPLCVTGPNQDQFHQHLEFEGWQEEEGI